MKKVVVLIAILAVLGGVLYYMFGTKKQLNANAKIAIDNLEGIDKIYLADMKGDTITLVKKDKLWWIGNEQLARQDAVNNMFETIQRATPTQPVPASMHNTVIKELASYGIKVELFSNGKIIQSLTVGNATNKGEGLCILKQGNDRPYIYKRGDFVGDLSVSFFTDRDDWRSRQIYYYQPDSVRKVTILYADNVDSSLVVNNNGDNLSAAYLTNKKIVNTSRVKVKEYMELFKEQFVLQYENELATKDSIISKGRPYGWIATEFKNNLSDTLFLVYYKATKKTSTFKTIDGVNYDNEFLLAYNKKDLMTISINSFAPILTIPSRFNK